MSGLVNNLRMNVFFSAAAVALMVGVTAPSVEAESRQNEIRTHDRGDVWVSSNGRRQHANTDRRGGQRADRGRGRGNHRADNRRDRPKFKGKNRNNRARGDRGRNRHWNRGRNRGRGGTNVAIFAPGFGFGFQTGPGRNFAYRGEFFDRSFHNYSRGWRGGWGWGGNWGWRGAWGWGNGFHRPYYRHFWGFDGFAPRWRFRRFGGYFYNPIVFAPYNFGGCYNCGGSAVAGALAGGVIGGLIGSEIDGGYDRSAGTLIGSLAGAAIGASVADRGESGRSRTYRGGHSDETWFEGGGHDGGSRGSYQRRTVPARPTGSEEGGLCMRYKYENGRYVCVDQNS